MKQALLATLCLVFCSSLYSQYYLRGEVRDEKGRLLPGVKINLSSKRGYSFFTGNTGAFGIPTSLAVDTITLNYEGYEVFKKPLQSKQYQVLVMKMLPATASLMKNRLTSRTKDLMADKNSFFSVLGESYSSLVENDFVNAGKYPETGFSLNVDRA